MSSGREYKTAELRKGESPDTTAHDLAHQHAKEALRKLLEEEEVEEDE